VDSGALTVDVAERVPLTDLASVHSRAAAGTLSGKVIVLPATARPVPRRRALAGEGRVDEKRRPLR